MIEIRLAKTTNEREQIYRFRYQIYSEEMGRRQDYADHDRRMIVEPLDVTGKVFGAWEDGSVVGTVRTNFARDFDLGYYEHLYSLQRAGAYHPQHTSITTKLMVAKNHRGWNLAVLLAVAAYKTLRENGIEFDFIDCNSHLVPLFFKWGYRLYKENAEHPEYGKVTPLVLALGDIQHLREVRSPFCTSCLQYPLDEAPVNFFHARLLPSAPIDGNTISVTPLRRTSI
jgi:hypothetical protein